MNVTIKRLGEYGGATLGVMLIENQPRWVTLEKPWKDNEVRKSCIPAGTYKAIRHTSTKHGVVFWLQDVPGRSEIMIHRGNSAEDTLGCILLGTSFGQAMGKGWISNPRHAMDLFMLALKNENEITITIENP